MRCKRIELVAFGGMLKVLIQKVVVQKVVVEVKEEIVAEKEAVAEKHKIKIIRINNVQLIIEQTTPPAVA